MQNMHPFRREMNREWKQFVARQDDLFPQDQSFRVDLHCHDRNSDVPDELWGRILRIPETWLSTDDLVKCLQSNGVDALTITNHNNARSCWYLLERGIDVLPGAEFTCTFPENDMKIHLLTYGFTPQQEEHLNRLRRNIYRFMDFVTEHNLPTVQPHPLYFYNPSQRPPMEMFEKFALLFERFEVLNGQRDIRQNLMTRAWLNTLTPEYLETIGRKHGISPGRFCRNPYRKRMTGGSDDHMGMFAGSCGTRFHVPHSERRLRYEKPSEILLDVLREGDCAPFGQVLDEEKLNIAFLDYFCQIALNMKDPGLVRMFLHRGTLKDKLICLALSNGIQELERHRLTMRFFKTFHEAMSGKRPGRLTNFLASKDMKPVVTMVDRIARGRKKGPEPFMTAVKENIPAIYRHMNDLLIQRLRGNWTNNIKQHVAPESPGELVRRFEIPSHLRHLFGSEGKQIGADMSSIKLTELFDDLSFPLLASTIIAGSVFTSTRVLHGNRAFLDQFAEKLDGAYRHPRRILWLTDTLEDKNGVSSVLQSTLNHVAANNLPIDFMICHNREPSRPHLKVVPAVDEFVLPGSNGQMIRVPDMLQVLKMFRDGGYDRIICSTELVMGLVALFLKKAFAVPANFYMHTDWMVFFEKNTNLDSHALDRVRRLLRALYRQFDGVFVLNREHREWLTGSAMGLASERVYQTAHWVEEWFRPHAEPKARVFPGVDPNDHVILFTGRLSEEKGVMDMPVIVSRLRKTHPNVRVVFAGTGVAEVKLRQALPDAVFLGWVDRKRLPVLYSAADFMVLPSRFDTFGCVVLEAMSCACPVAAYDTRGPADIITHGANGILGEDAIELADHMARVLSDSKRHHALRREALVRSNEYCPVNIMDNLMRDAGMYDCNDNRVVPFETRSGANAAEEQENLLADFLEIVS